MGAPTPSVTLRTYLLAIYRTNIGRENASSSAGCGFERGVRTLPLLHAPSNNMLRFSKSSVSVLQNTWGMTFTYTQRTCSTAAKAQRHNGAPCDKPKGTHCSPHSGHTPPIQRILICGLRTDVSELFGGRERVFVIVKSLITIVKMVGTGSAATCNFFLFLAQVLRQLARQAARPNVGQIRTCIGQAPG